MQKLRVIWSLVLAAVAFQTVHADTVIDVPPFTFPNNSNSNSYSVQSGTTLNIYDGALLNKALGADSGGTINIYGGQFSQGLYANSGSIVNVENATMMYASDFTMGGGSSVTLRGGRFANVLEKQSTASLVIQGVDFAIGGLAIPGLSQPGDQVSITLPEETLFTGIFANGAPFALYNSTVTGSRLYGSITLQESSRPSGRSVVNLPVDPTPEGALPSQTVIVGAGGTLPFAENGAPGSMVSVQGGSLPYFTAYKSSVEVVSGTSGRITGYDGASIRYAGGDNSQLVMKAGAAARVDGGTLTIGYMNAGSKLDVYGGVVSQLMDYSGSEVTVQGGEVDRISVQSGSTLHIEGGLIAPTLSINGGAHVSISGGHIGTGDDALISAGGGADLTIYGTQFLRNGVSMPGLSHPGDSMVFTDRVGDLLSLILADGTPMKLIVDDMIPVDEQQQPQMPQSGIIAPTATLRLVMVPEPDMALVALLGMLASVVQCRRRIG